MYRLPPSLVGSGQIRRSGFAAGIWLLPFVILVAAILMTTLAMRELDRAYRRDAGVVRLQQLLPYGLVLRYSDFGSSGTSDTKRRRVEHRWRQTVRQLTKEEVATTSWQERGGAVVVVLAARTASPPDLIQGLRKSSSPVSRVRAWPEGERVAMVLIMTKSDSNQELDRATVDRERSVRSSVGLQRAASLTASAVVPSIAVAVVLNVALIVLILVLALMAIALSPAFRRRGRHRTDSSAGGGGDAGLAAGVEIVQLPGGRTGSSVGYLRAVPLAIVAMPAGTPSLWPASLVWAAIIGLTIVLAMKWSRGSRPAKWLRRLVYVVIALGLGHALLSWPSQLPAVDDRMVGALGAAAALVLLLAVVRRRGTQEPRVGIGLLGARWLLLLVGFVLLASSSVALFFASNSEAEVRANVQFKLLALLGLIGLSIAARRLRAARSLAQRERLRRQHRPEVLYLRSFVDDGLRVRSKRRSRSGLERWLPWPTELFEDVLLRGFECVGPVVAIGKPGSSQTELGASRDLVIGRDWLTVVKGEIERARFITVVLGPGKGLSTELLTLRELGRLDRVCIVVPPVLAREATDRLAAGTQAFDGDRAWGDIASHAVDEKGEIVALVGIGDYRAVVVAKRRALASTYMSLADRVCADIAAHALPAGG
jgi:hypothetical protein